MLVTLPILIPLVGAAACVAAWGRAWAQLAIALAGGVGLAVAAVALLVATIEHGTLVETMGGGAAPYGIALVGDRFSAIMTLLAALVGLAVIVYSFDASTRRAAEGYFPLVLAMLAAVCGAFLSGDLFNLYVWFELMLLSSFVLLTMGGRRAQVEGAIKYVTLNLFSSVLFLATVGLIYASTGTLNMAHLALRLDAMEDPAMATALGAPLLVAFGVKAAVFPLFFWLPASYHTPLPAVSALFAGLLTKVGVYSLIRATTLMFDQERALLGDAVMLVAGLTMVTGVLGATAQNDMRRILSFHIVSQIGYMVMGLGIALAVLGRGVADEAGAALAGLALTGSVLYLIHHIVVKTNLFLIAGAVLRVRGVSELGSLGGLASTHPVLAGLFLVSAFSLAGIPILSGFWAKLVLGRAGLEAEAYGIVAASLVVSLLTLYSMTKIWIRAFWGEAPAPGAGAVGGESVRAPAMYGAIAGLAVVSVFIGLGASLVYPVAAEAALDLLASERYIEAVLPGALGGGEP